MAVKVTIAPQLLLNAAVLGFDLTQQSTTLLQHIVNLSMQVSDAQKLAEHYTQQRLSDAWAFAAWMHACAVNSHSKELVVKNFKPNQIACLADVMTDSHGVRSIKLKGIASP